MDHADRYAALNLLTKKPKTVIARLVATSAGMTVFVFEKQGRSRAP